MAEEIKKVIVIDTKQAVDGMKRISEAAEESSKGFNTLSEYKRYIDLLRQSTEKMDKSSKEYERTLKQINSSEKYLSRELERNTKNVKAAEGSYDALAKTMADLKKEWKATGDEAKRNEIGRNINDINNQLKEMDASVGNFQRNVGDYQGAFTRSLHDLTDGLDLIIPGAKNVARAIDDIFKGFEGAKGIKGLFSGTGGGGIFKVLFGKDGADSKDLKNVEKAAESMKKFQLAETAAEAASVSLAGSIKAETTSIGINTASKLDSLQAEQRINAQKLVELGFIKKTNDANGKNVIAITEEFDLKRKNLALDRQIAVEKAKNTAATEADTVATTANNTAKKQGIALTKVWKSVTASMKGLLSSLPLLAVVAGLTALYSWISKIIEKRKEQKEALIAARVELRSIGIEAMSTTEQFKLFAKAFKEAEGDITKQNNIINVYNSTLGKTLGTIKDINAARSRFIDDSDKIIESLLDQAKAEAALKLLGDKAIEIEKKKIELEERLTVARSNVKTDIYTGGVNSAGTELRKIAKEREELQKEYNEYAAFIRKSLDEIFVKGNIFNNQETEDTGTDIIVDYYTGSLTKVTDKLKSWVRKISKDKKDKIDPLNIVLDDDSDKILEDESKRFEEAFNIFDNLVTSELQQLQRKYDTELAMLEQYGFDTTKLTEKFEKDKTDIALRGIEERLKAVDEESAARIFIADKTIKNEHERDKAILDIEREGLEQKRQILEDKLNTVDIESEAYKKLAADIEAVNAQIIDANNRSAKLSRQYAADIAQASFQAIEQLSNSMNEVFSFMQEGIQKRLEAGEITEEQANKEFEETKKWQIAMATINMLSGIAAAIASPIAMAAGPAGWIAAAAQAATVAVTGALQIAKIKQTTLNSGSSSGSVTVSDKVNTYTPNYTRNLTGENERRVLNQSSEELIMKAVTKVPVYVSVTDINSVQNKVKVREDESRF